MSEISDKLLDEAFKSIGPLLSPWRIVLSGSVAFCISPKFDSKEILKIITGPSADLVKSIVNSLTAVPLWELGAIFFICSLGIPKFSAWLLGFFITHFHIERSKSIINNLLLLKNKKPTQIANKYARHINKLHVEKNKQRGNIIKLKLLSEILTGFFISASIFLFYKNYIFLGIIGIPLIIAQAFFISRQITFSYLTKIAQYKIIVEALQKAGTVSFSKRPII